MINYMNTNQSANVRILHAVPDAPNVDVYANGALLAANVAYGQVTAYMPVEKGTYEITIYPAGTNMNPVVRQMLCLEANENLTIAAIGTLSTISGMAIIDSNQPMQSGKAMVRFIHLSPNAPAVDITLPDGTVLFSNVSYQQATQYIAVPPANYTLQVRVANTNNVVLTVPNVQLGANNYYTVYAIGLAGGMPPLSALAVMDYQ